MVVLCADLCPGEEAIKLRDDIEREIMTLAAAARRCGQGAASSRGPLRKSTPINGPERPD